MTNVEIKNIGRREKCLNLAVQLNLHNTGADVTSVIEDAENIYHHLYSSREEKL